MNWIDIKGLFTGDALRNQQSGWANGLTFSFGLACLLAIAAVAPGFAATAPAKYGSRDIAGMWMGVGSFANPAGPPPWQNTPWPKRPAFTAWGAAEARRQADPKNVPSCLPGGPVFAMTGTGNFPIQITESPGRILMVFENYPLPRHVFMDGRSHPPEPDPTWMGHSIGHWEGDVLVADTVGTNGKFRPINGTVTDLSEAFIEREPRLPTSEQLHMVERIRLVGNGEFLEDQITIDDPKVYTAPFTATHYWRRSPDLDFVEYYCMENPRPEAEGYKALPEDAR